MILHQGRSPRRRIVPRPCREAAHARALGAAALDVVLERLFLITSDESRADLQDPRETLNCPVLLVDNERVEIIGPHTVRTNEVIVEQGTASSGHGECQRIGRYLAPHGRKEVGAACCHVVEAFGQIAGIPDLGQCGVGEILVSA